MIRRVLKCSELQQDGGETLEEADAHPNKSENAATAEGEKATLYGWRFSKSPLGKSTVNLDVKSSNSLPLGSGEFLLIDESKPEEVKLVVRTINSSAFSNNDWKELVVNVRAKNDGVPNLSRTNYCLCTGSIRLQHQVQGFLVLVPKVRSNQATRLQLLCLYRLPEVVFRCLHRGS
jgi:hypothetical protein